MSEVKEKGMLLQKASRQAGTLSSEQKDSLLQALSDQIRASRSEIIEANTLDLENGKRSNLSEALLDRLMLDQQRIDAIADSILTVKQLADPIGEVLEQTTRPNGLNIKKIRVPMGVVGMIYEARPNVTPDAFALAFKAGSAVMLRGGSAAINSNKAFVRIAKHALSQQGLSEHLIELIEDTDRATVKQMLTLDDHLDLIIPRGGAGLIKTVVETATVPVIETGSGICHVYVDKAADLPKALRIAYNSKVQRPSVCNSAETLLVHQAVAERMLPEIIANYQQAGVTVIADERVREIFSEGVQTATDEDWATEYLDLKISIKIVDSLDEAIEHIMTYSTNHTESIVSEDQQAIDKFSMAVDSSAIMINTSTRFTDGGEFGFGCEIGISTQKLHARGPMGLKEMTTYKYIVSSDGLIRS